MNAIAAAATPLQSRRWLLAAAGFALIVAGALRAQSVEQFIGYVVVLLASVLPAALWVREGARGIPVFPVMASAYALYYAWPLLGGNQSTLDYTPGEMLLAGITVAGFLALATLVWMLVVRAGAIAKPRPARPDNPARVLRLQFAGLLLGVTFHTAIIYGWIQSIGSAFGLVRSLAVTFVMVSCFLVGVSRAKGLLRDKAWVAALCVVAVLVMVCFASLFLIGGVMYGAAVAAGYVMVTRHPPWRGLAAAALLITIMHAGKAEMRERYWQEDTNFGGISSALQIPGLIVSWVGAGLGALVSGEIGTSALDRASLLQMVLIAQTQTPEYVEYLDGETYAMLPSILIPRFIDEDKPATQIGMDMLNIRYGLLTIEGAATTAIGWGLIAEAFANFGYAGVALIALGIGLFCGLLANWSRDANIVSTPTLVSIAAMMGLLNLEADFLSLSTATMQSMFSALVFAWFYKWFVSAPVAVPRS
jgi:hypothetical protein